MFELRNGDVIEFWDAKLNVSESAQLHLHYPTSVESSTSAAAQTTGTGGGTTTAQAAAAANGTDDGTGNGGGSGSGNNPLLSGAPGFRQGLGGFNFEESRREVLFVDNDPNRQAFFGAGP